MSEKTAVERWAPRSLETLLEELTELARRASAGEPVHRPFLTLHLRSGRDLDGFLLGLSADRHGNRTLLLHLPGPERYQAQDAAHVPFGVVEAITVRDVGRLDAPPPGAPEPPTRLELRRRVAATEKKLQEKLGAPLALKLDTPEDPKALDALAHLEALLVEVLGKVAQSDLGKEALKKVSAASLHAGETAAVSLEAGELSLTTGTAHPRRFTAKSLEEAVEKVL